MRYEAPELLPLLPAINAIQTISLCKSHTSLPIEGAITHNDTMPCYMDWED